MSGSGFLAGFMFGNVNAEGELEDDILDKDAFQQLSNLEGQGLLGDIGSDVVQGVRHEEEDDDYDQLDEGDGPSSSSEQIDFVDIDEVAEDQEETEAVKRAQEQRMQQEYYQKGLVFTHGTGAAAEEEEEDYDTPDEVAMDTSVSVASYVPAQQTAAAPGLGQQTSQVPAPPTTQPQALAPPTTQTLAPPTQPQALAPPTQQQALDPPTQPQVLVPPTQPQVLAPPTQPQVLAPPTQPTVPETQVSEELYQRVKQLFPSFKSKGLLRFSSLLGMGRPSCLPKIWAGAKKPKRKKQRLQGQYGAEGEDRSEHWTLDLGGTPPQELLASDDEDWLLSGADDRHGNLGAGRKRGRSGGRTRAWRHGPAKYWYDQLNVPEDGGGFDYGFKLKPPPQQKGEIPDDEGKPPSDDGLPDDAFYMVAQCPWENDIIFDASPQSIDKSSWPHLPGMQKAPAPPPQLLGEPAPPLQAGEGRKSSGGDIVYSLFPPENSDVIYSWWEDQIIFDPEAMDEIPRPKVVRLDPNDPRLIVGIPEEPEARELEAPRDGKKEKRRSQLLMRKLNRSEQKPALITQKKDMFNVSNDEYYNPKLTSETSLVDLEGASAQHSIPASRLHPLWFPTHYSRHMLRNFHRPKLKGLSSPDESTGFVPVLNLVKHMADIDKDRERERVGSGGGEVFFMRCTDDLSPCDSQLVLFEYAEEHPLLLNNIGMAFKIKNYYRRPERQKESPPQLPYGETSYVLSTSYFLGQLHPGQSLQSVESSMFRSPLYPHTVPQGTFLVIRSGDSFYLREVRDIFTVGQECPKTEVPGPNSKQDKAFQRDFLTLTLYRLFAESTEVPKQLRMDQVKAAFPHLSENVIRKRLKLFANFERFGSEFSNYGCWMLRSDFRLPSEEELRDLVTPEQFCAHASMKEAEQRLKDAGYGGKSLLFMEDEDDEDISQKLDDEVLAAPWNTTKHFINAMKGRYMLQLNGPADPTGCGEGFSYIRMSSKALLGKEDPLLANPPKKRSGTDADLRKLKLDKAKSVLRGFGVPEEEINRLSRWEVVDVVRTMSTEAAKAGSSGLGSFKFARGRLLHLTAQERYKEECQHVFDLQNKVLASTEVLSTDEESSDEEGSEDELAKNLGSFINKKSTQQMSYEEEEMERADLIRRLMAEDKKAEGSEGKTGMDTPRSASPPGEGDDTMSGVSPYLPGRRLEICRTFSQNGVEYQRKETVKNPAVIEAYLKFARNKDKDQFRLIEQDVQEKEEMRKEKKRLQDQLRRIKKMEGQGKHGKLKKDKPKPETTLKMKCGACGQLGHMKTNKNCPLFKKLPVQVAMTEAQEEAEKESMMARGDLVKVEGTKISLSKALIEHAHDMKKKALVLKFPKEKLRKRKRQGEDDLEYLGKRTKTVHRRDTNPEVPFSAALDKTLTKLRSLPEAAHFQKPVSAKQVPDYYTIIKFPMDLQTIKENLRQHYYRSTEMFLEHVNLIVTNCITYNGFGSDITRMAQKVLEVCTEDLKKNEEELSRLERKINPALDDNACVAFSYFLETFINRMKCVPESSYFHYPVSAKQLPDYHKVVANAMDLETMRKNCKRHRYHTCAEFMRDVELVVQNSATYNGPDSVFTKTTEQMREVSRQGIEENRETLEQLEAKIAEVESRKEASTRSFREAAEESLASTPLGEISVDASMELSNLPIPTAGPLDLDLMVLGSGKVDPSLFLEEGGGADIGLDAGVDLTSLLQQDLQTSPQQSSEEEEEEEEDDEEGEEEVMVDTPSSMMDTPPGATDTPPLRVTDTFLNTPPAFEDSRGSSSLMAALPSSSDSEGVESDDSESEMEDVDD